MAEPAGRREAATIRLPYIVQIPIVTTRGDMTYHTYIVDAEDKAGALMKARVRATDDHLSVDEREWLVG